MINLEANHIEVPRIDRLIRKLKAEGGTLLRK